MKEFIINKLLAVKSEKGLYIEVNGKEIWGCRRIELPLFPKETFSMNQFQYIDHLRKDYIYSDEFDDETKFWALCSNLQVWYETDYDPRFLATNLALSLLKELSNEGDILAKSMLKKEIMFLIMRRDRSKLRYIFDNRYLDCFDQKENLSFLKSLVEILGLNYQNGIRPPERELGNNLGLYELITEPEKIQIEVVHYFGNKLEDKIFQCFLKIFLRERGSSTLGPILKFLIQKFPEDSDVYKYGIKEYLILNVAEKAKTIFKNYEEAKDILIEIVRKTPATSSDDRRGDSRGDEFDYEYFDFINYFLREDFWRIPKDGYLMKKLADILKFELDYFCIKKDFLAQEGLFDNGISVKIEKNEIIEFSLSLNYPYEYVSEYIDDQSLSEIKNLLSSFTTLKRLYVYCPVPYNIDDTLESKPDLIRELELKCNKQAKAFLSIFNEIKQTGLDIEFFDSN